MSTTSPLSTYVDDLISHVSSAVGKTSPSDRLGLAVVQSGFEEFGRRSSRAGLELDESLSGAISGLQVVISGSSVYESESETTLIAGKALAAFCNGYYGDLEPSHRGAGINPATGSDSRRLWALHDISRQAAIGAETSELLNRAVRVIASTTKSDACAAFLNDESTGLLVLGGAYGLNPASVGVLTIRSGEGITGMAVQKRQTVVAQDAQNHPSWVRARHFGDTIYVSQISVPMTVNGSEQLIGVLNVLSTDRRETTPDELDFLETVANELAMCVEYSRMRNLTDERLNRKIEELGLLQRVSRSVASSLDAEDVLRMIVESAAELTGAEAAALFRLDRSVGKWSHTTPIQEFRIGYERKVTNEIQRDEIIRQVIERGEGRATEVEYLDGSNYVYCLPMSSAREAWGAISVRLPPGERLTTEGVSLLNAFTDVASIAIEHAKLFEEVQQSAQTSSTLLQEMHHRVRNNLQTLAALLSLQLRQATSEETVRHLTEASGRIQAIAAVHDLLSEESQVDTTSLASITKLVADQVCTSIRPPNLELQVEIDVDEISIPSKEANLLAIILNELMSNAVNHGFANVIAGTIRVVGRQAESSNVMLVVENDGERVGESFDLESQSGLGLKIVQRLVQSDLRGSFTIQSLGKTGTRVEIEFPNPIPSRYESAGDDSPSGLSSTE